VSPEQAQLNNLDVDTRSDVYSLGVLLYEMLTGTTPLERQRLQDVDSDEMRRLIREEEPPRPSDRLSSTETLPSLAACRKAEPAGLTKQLRGELDWIVMKALEKDHDRRYDTANAFALDVRRFLAGEPVLAVPPSAGYRLRKFARKHRAALSVAVTFVLLLVAGVTVSVWQAVRATNAGIRERTKAEEARAAQEEADQNADRARANERLAYDRAYNSDLRLAPQAWERNQFDFFRELLDRQRPERTDGNERRGFEWHYWDRQLGLRDLTFARPGMAVLCVAFSPDGSVVASGVGLPEPEVDTRDLGRQDREADPLTVRRRAADHRPHLQPGRQAAGRDELRDRRPRLGRPDGQGALHAGGPHRPPRPCRGLQPRRQTHHDRRRR
jgi:hypothetical protein